MGFFDKLLGARPASARQPAGYDCPFFFEGICRVGTGRGGVKTPCTLGKGHYWNDCHVYPTTGLKGKFDRDRADENRRRANQKTCKRCNAALEISQDLDFRWAIGEYTDEVQFTALGDRAGVSCAGCRADFCTKCMLTFGKRHPSSGGLACLNCGGNMSTFKP